MRLPGPHVGMNEQCSVIRLNPEPPMVHFGRRSVSSPSSQWDCLALIDDATVDPLMGQGGVAAIAISPPARLHHDGGVEPRLRASADPPARG